MKILKKLLIIGMTISLFNSLLGSVSNVNALASSINRGIRLDQDILRLISSL